MVLGHSERVAPMALGQVHTPCGRQIRSHLDKLVGKQNSNSVAGFRPTISANHGNLRSLGSKHGSKRTSAIVANIGKLM